jgi:hypothetical protein
MSGSGKSISKAVPSHAQTRREPDQVPQAEARNAK